MKIRLLVVITVILISAIVSVNAQESEFDIVCFNLSTEDCALLNTASENTNNITSFTQTFSIDLLVTGLSALSDITDTTEDDTLSLQMTGNGPLVITDSGEVPLALSMNVDVSAIADADTNSASLSLILIDDFLYLARAGLPGELSERINAEWAAIDLTQSLDNANSGGIFPVLPDNNDTENTLDSVNTPELREAVATLQNVPDAVNFVRLPEDENGLIPFSLTMDLATILGSDEFTSVLSALIRGQVGEQLGLDPDAIDPDDDQTAGAFADILTLLVPDASLQENLYVDPATGLLTQIEIFFDFTLDLGLLLGDTELEPVVASLGFVIQLSGIDESYEIVPPSDFEIIDPDSDLDFNLFDADA